MKWGYLTVEKSRNNHVDFYISGYYFDGKKGYYLPELGYTYYGIRQALKMYKDNNALTRKHNIEIQYKGW